LKFDHFILQSQNYSLFVCKNMDFRLQKVKFTTMKYSNITLDVFVLDA